ncbi:MAG TPA: cyanophycinase [Chloroflexia bacterium]|nr:cyanophycinase [Chloroflexia bacterium]
MNASHASGDTAHRPALLDAPWRTPGLLMIIGGADRLDPDASLARLFLHLVDRASSNSHLRDIVLVSTATRHPEILTGEYIRILGRLGIPSDRIFAPLIRNRDEAHDSENARLLAGAAGIFITGGDQYALTQALDHTPCEEAMMESYRQGGIIAGTSAGATAMGRPMIVAGGGNGELRMGMVQSSHGLGWAGNDIIIDTHFGARGRFPRLASAVAEHPAALGVGIDENTCLLVSEGGHCVVEGSGVIYFVDATHAEINSTRHARTGEPVTIGTLRVDIVSAGGAYSLGERRASLAIEHSLEV